MSGYYYHHDINNLGLLSINYRQMPPSNITNVVVNAGTTVSNPSQFVTNSSTSVTLSWTGGAGVSSYDYYVNGTKTTPTTDNGVSANYAVFTVTANYRYTFYIVGRTSTGTVTSINLPNSTSIGAGGCVMWLDSADKSTITGTTSVTKFVDKSTNAYNFIQLSTYGLPSTANLNATNTTNTLNFNGSQLLASAAAAIPTSPYTIFAVFNNTTAGYSYVISSYYDFHIFYGNFSGTTNFFVSCGSTAWVDVGTAMNPTASVTSLSLTAATNAYTPTNTGGVLQSYINGMTYGTKQGLNTGTNYLGIGAAINNGAGSQYLNGNICEIIFYNSVLSSSDRMYVEGYLAWKWGIQANLRTGASTGPTTHTYGSAPPTGMAVWNP